MGTLKVLPASLANMIAAGEVVQRPASVVKELMENAVDAGATQVTVVISDSGRTLIQVIDNGCGMSPADAVLCFERHATSKIASADDLSEILTYGFRGEALASIAAVSEITLKTRRDKDATGTCVRIEEYGKLSSSECSAPVGSNFAVRNLFYNTPARRKFMKSDNVELKHIIEEFTRVAITRPEVAFSLSNNGRDIFVLKKAASLKFRIMDLLGTNVTGDIVDIHSQTSVVNVSGFVGRPDTARKTLGNQFFFINGRFFRSPYLHKAVMNAYEELMPEGLTPSYFIFLEADPHTIDVNIHPTKTEIKFEDEHIVFQIIYACVKETLGRNSFGASIDFDTEGAVDLPQLGKSFEEYRGGVSEPLASADPTFNPFESLGPGAAFPSSTPSFPDVVEGGTSLPGFDTVPSGGASFPGTGASSFAGGGFHSGTAGAVDRRQNYGALFEDKSLPSARLMIVQGKYILVPAASGVMAVNIRRARERIIYEKSLKALSRESHVTQTALFPVEVQVGAQMMPVFAENAPMLGSLGFDISPVGTDSLVINGVPEGYSCEPGKVQRMVEDLCLILTDGCGALPELMNQQLAAKFATLGASSAEALTSPQEAQRLVDALFSCANSELTPGGKRIVGIISVEEIEKKF